MATSDDGGGSEKQIGFVNFNHDYTSLAVGTPQGYRIYSLSNISRPREVCRGADDVLLVERLSRSTQIAIIRRSSPKRFEVWDYVRGRETKGYNYTSAILAAKFNRSYMVICLEKLLYIHSLGDLKVRYTVDTPEYSTGVCALANATKEGVTRVAYPCVESVGQIQIINANDQSDRVTISAHNTSLVALAFCNDGSLIASASERGTVIRVFSVIDGSRTHEFRRGLARNATIYSLAFSADSTMLACVSNFETVHIFKLDKANVNSGSGDDEHEGLNTAGNAPGSNSDEGWLTWLGKLVFPTVVSNTFTLERSFVTAKLPSCGVPCVVAWTKTETPYRLLVASTSGYWYVYGVSAEPDKESMLQYQHDFHQDFTRSPRKSAGSTPTTTTTGTSAGDGERVSDGLVGTRFRGSAQKNRLPDEVDQQT